MNYQIDACRNFFALQLTVIHFAFQIMTMIKILFTFHQYREAIFPQAKTKTI